MMPQPGAAAADRFPRRVFAAAQTWDLHDIAATLSLEDHYTAILPPHTLMGRAGLTVARLAMALYPAAQTIWIACGPGNNGGDGLEAAAHLLQWGKQVHLTWLGESSRSGADTQASYQQAIASGLKLRVEPPLHFDLAIDALLGIGAAAPDDDHRSLSGRLAEWSALMNANTAPVLAIDLPSGLQADTGCAAPNAVRAHHTLSLVTLKPGLFTRDGRDHCGEIWFDPLGCNMDSPSHIEPAARLVAHANDAPARLLAPHASHKGSFGDVVIVGGALGMTGAALLAASAALHGGAGRVLVGLLDSASVSVDPGLPELMFRPVDSLDLSRAITVCGCGGGDAVRRLLPRVLSAAPVLVLDADALNALSADTGLQSQLKSRASRGWHSVLTPHPLEAARLLGCSTAQVQGNRLDAARELAGRFKAVTVLKGSGTVIAAPGQMPLINPSGNARLATAGTGDVLAGLIGACLASGRGGAGLASANLKAPANSFLDAVVQAVYRHGAVADRWPASEPLTASALARRV